MKIDESDRALWSVLRDIKNLYSLSREHVPFEIEVMPGPNDIHYRAMVRLEELSAITILEESYDQDGIDPGKTFTIRVEKQKFNELFGRYKAKFQPPKTNDENNESRPNTLTKNLGPELIAGKLIAYSDGTIRYNGQIIELRPQLKELCRLFMRDPKRLITLDDIREKIIQSDKRDTTSYTTISKYVSELRKPLKIHFKKNVIINQKLDGWYFEPEK